MSMQLESNLELRLELAERKADALTEVKHFLERFEGNLLPPRDKSDRDWRRGACFVIEQALALIEQAGGA